MVVKHAVAAREIEQLALPLVKPCIDSLHSHHSLHVIRGYINMFIIVRSGRFGNAVKKPAQAGV